MIPYIITFGISTLFAYISEFNFRRKKNRYGCIYLLIAVIPLLLLAWARNPSLGYDMELYGIKVFENVKGLNISKIKTYIDNSIIESGYLWIVYILSRIKPDINFMMIGLQLINTFAFVCLAYKYREKCSITLMMIMYETTWYLFTYNILRQSISLAICLFMILCFENKKYIMTIALFILGTYFHDSMIFSIISVMILIIMSSKNKSLKNKIIFCVLITILSILVLIFYNNIINICSDIGLIGEKYVDKLSNGEFRTKIDIEYSLLFLKTATILLGILYFASKAVSKEEKNNNLKWFTMLIIDFIVTFLSFKIRNTDRITWYLYYPALFIFVPQTIKIFKKNKVNRVLAYSCISSVFILYFLEKMITNQYNICPYVSNLF